MGQLFDKRAFDGDLMPPRILGNADYAAGGIELQPNPQRVWTTPGAAGALGLILPWLGDMPYGGCISIVHYGTTNNTTVTQRADGIATLSIAALTANLDRVTVMALGDHWALIEDVTT